MYTISRPFTAYFKCFLIPAADLDLDFDFSTVILILISPPWGFHAPCIYTLSRLSRLLTAYFKCFLIPAVDLDLHLLHDMDSMVPKEFRFSTQLRK